MGSQEQTGMLFVGKVEDTSQHGQGERLLGAVVGAVDALQRIYSHAIEKAVHCACLHVCCRAGELEELDIVPGIECAKHCQRKLDLR